MKAEIFNHSEWINETDPDILKNKFDQLLKESDFSILNFMENYFIPKGYTCIWLLGESHLAIHTFPEEKKSYIELASCNQEKHNYFVHNIYNGEAGKNYPNGY